MSGKKGRKTKKKKAQVSEQQRKECEKRIKKELEKQKESYLTKLLTPSSEEKQEVGGRVLQQALNFVNAKHILSHEDETIDFFKILTAVIHLKTEEEIEIFFEQIKLYFKKPTLSSFKKDSSGDDIISEVSTTSRVFLGNLQRMKVQLFIYALMMYQSMCLKCLDHETFDVDKEATLENLKIHNAKYLELYVQKKKKSLQAKITSTKNKPGHNSLAQNTSSLVVLCTILKYCVTEKIVLPFLIKKGKLTFETVRAAILLGFMDFNLVVETLKPVANSNAGFVSRENLQKLELINKQVQNVTKTIKAGKLWYNILVGVGTFMF